MVVPYCMIHFGKPWPEALSSIAAGILLGTIALRTRSIWIGFFIHESVAFSMDLVALLKTDGIPLSVVAWLTKVKKLQQTIPAGGELTDEIHKNSDLRRLPTTKYNLITFFACFPAYLSAEN